MRLVRFLERTTAGPTNPGEVREDQDCRLPLPGVAGHDNGYTLLQTSFSEDPVGDVL